MTQTTVPVIFDLAGTLVDPADGISGGIAVALRELGLAVPGRERLNAMIGPKLSHSLVDIAGVPVEQLDEAIRIYRSHYLSTGIAQGRVYEGVRALLESYVDAGRPIGVATQKPEHLARIVLEHHGLAGLFHTIRGSAADESAVAAGPAGKAGIIAAALADLGTRDAVMVGDRAQDVAGAAANGLECIGVGWGFALDGELRDAGAAAVVHSTSALHETIVRLDAVRADTLQTLNEVHTDGNV